ncbi:MAG TPA: GAF domain-containing sensor histidine kinase [Chloroflexia bacterium]|nr:GAF domain-containing sensor histidine kinase [Chloroflexia bacterium]
MITDRVLAELTPLLEPAEFLPRLHSLVREWLPHDAALVATVEGKHPARLRVAVKDGFNGAGSGMSEFLAPRSLIDPWAIDGGPLNIPDLQDTHLRVSDLFTGQGMRSLISIPLGESADGTTEVVLLLAHRQPAAFANVDDSSLEALRRTVAVPWANARRFGHSQAAARELLSKSVQLWHVLGSEADVATSLLRLLDQALAIAGARAGTIMSVVAENDALYVRASRGMHSRAAAGAQLPWGSAAAAPVRAMSEPLRLVDLLAQDAPARIGIAADEGLCAYYAFPLRVSASGDPLGLLNLYWPEPAVTLDEDQRLLLQGLTHAVAATLLQHELAEHQAACDRLVEQFHAHKVRMVSLIGHQLRTPVTSISGYAQLMLRREQDPKSSTARYAETILSSSRRMGHLIDNVIELSHLEDTLVAMQQRPFDLHALLDDLRSDPMVQSASGRRLAWEMPDDLPAVIGDPLRFKQALLALLRRAGSLAGTAGEPLLVRAQRVHGSRPPAVEVAIGETGEPERVTTGEDVLALIDLRSAVDSQSDRDDELALYTALQLLQGMQANLRIETDAAARTAYVVELPVVAEK